MHFCIYCGSIIPQQQEILFKSGISCQISNYYNYIKRRRVFEFFYIILDFCKHMVYNLTIETQTKALRLQKERGALMKKDAANKHFLKKPKRIADLLNGYFFKGSQVILPEDIQKITIEQSSYSKDGQSPSQTEERYHDLVCHIVKGVNIFVLGIENQSNMDPSMVLRSMEYTVGQYKNQRRNIRIAHETAGDLKGDEFLSGFSVSDRFKPTALLVIYYGDKPWEGARTLHKLLDWSDIPDEWRFIFADYRMHLLEVNKIENLEDYHSDLKLLFGILNYRKNKEKMASFIEENKELFKSVSNDLLYVISQYSHSSKVMKKIEEYKHIDKEEGGTMNMSHALDEIVEDRVNDGIEKRLPLEVEKRLSQEIEKRIPQEIEKRIPQEIKKRLTENNQKISNLISTLLSENKLAELKKIAEDAVYLEKLLAFYPN